MLTRQKAILYMLRRAGRPVSRTELTKWAFLVARETPSGGGASFYQFLPYHFGPFSFCLYREVKKLVSDGLLDEPDEKTWELTEDARQPTGDVSGEIKADVAKVVDRFLGSTVDELLDYVYERHPWYTVNSRRRKLRQRPVAEAAAYTAGYEGQSVDGFLNMLVRCGMQRVIDVRQNPVARRFGFHKSTLSRLCGDVSIEYVHLPQLGVPSELRRGLETQDDYEALFDRYEAEILPVQAEALDRIAEMMAEKPSAVVCMEADPNRCHRTRVAKAVSEGAALAVRHLEPGE